MVITPGRSLSTGGFITGSTHKHFGYPVDIVMIELQQHVNFLKYSQPAVNAEDPLSPTLLLFLFLYRRMPSVFPG